MEQVTQITSAAKEAINRLGGSTTETVIKAVNSGLAAVAAIVYLSEIIALFVVLGMIIYDVYKRIKDRSPRQKAVANVVSAGNPVNVGSPMAAVDADYLYTV